MGDLWEAVENSISELSQLRVRKAPAEVTSGTSGPPSRRWLPVTQTHQPWQLHNGWSAWKQRSVTDEGRSQTGLRRLCSLGESPECA